MDVELMPVSTDWQDAQKSHASKIVESYGSTNSGRGPAVKAPFATLRADEQESIQQGHARMTLVIGLRVRIRQCIIVEQSRCFKEVT